MAFAGLSGEKRGERAEGDGKHLRGQLHQVMSIAAILEPSVLSAYELRVVACFSGAYWILDTIKSLLYTYTRECKYFHVFAWKNRGFLLAREVIRVCSILASTNSASLRVIYRREMSTPGVVWTLEFLRILMQSFSSFVLDAITR